MMSDPDFGVLRCPAGAPGIVRVWGRPATDAERLADRLAADPAGAGIADEGAWWAAVALADGAVVACVSSTVNTGLFWTRDTRPDGTVELVLGPRLGAVVEARVAPTTLDEAFIAGFLGGPAPAERTPYREVGCIPPGTSAIWAAPDAEPRVTEWSGPSVWPEPTVGGPGTIEQYVRTFDAAVDALVPSTGPLCATMSGGLDSTFVVASLVRHATPERPVVAFTHVPHPDAGLVPLATWDPDDSHVAEAMERRYPGLVRIERFANTDLVQPLDATAAWNEAAWAPTVAPANIIWMSAMQASAAAMGSSVLFTGENGNAAFSWTHTYAAAHHLRRREFGELIGLVRDGMAAGSSLPGALRHRVIGPLVGTRYYGRRQRVEQARYFASIGLPEPEQAGRTESPRARYLAWMRDTTAVRMSLNPVPGRALYTDPFRAHGVLELAAAMTPREWRRGIADRGYARLLGEGRVPDEIRLRTRRGGQSWDHWFVVRHQRDRYMDEVRALRATPVIEHIVDVDRFERTVAALPWGEPGPANDIVGVDRILSLAAFVRMTAKRLAALAAR
jgi:hypothetical protein